MYPTVECSLSLSLCIPEVADRFAVQKQTAASDIIPDESMLHQFHG